MCIYLFTDEKTIKGHIYLKRGSWLQKYEACSLLYAQVKEETQEAQF